MKSNKKTLKQFKQLENNTLIGGFSIVSQISLNSQSLIVKNPGCQITNNCNGGNCVAGCGTKD